MKTREEYTIVAKLTNEFIRKMLTHGSNNIIDKDKVDFQRGNASRAAAPILALTNALHGNIPSESVFAKIALLGLKKYGYGQCGELAQAAFMHLIEQGVFPLDYCVTTGGCHSLLVIGRVADSDPRNMATWGDSAIVCDPWSNKVYPASEFNKEQKDNIGGSYNDDIYKVLGAPIPPPYLSGVIFPQHGVKNDTEAQQFVKLSKIEPELLTFFEHPIKSDEEMYDDMSKMKSMLSGLMNSPLGTNPGALPALSQAADCLASLKVGLDQRNVQQKKEESVSPTMLRK